MAPEQQQKYFTMLDHLQNDRPEAAKEIVSDILSQKLAAALQSHNETQLQANQQNLENDKKLAVSAAASSGE
jgi:hypothetical protein